MFVPVISYPDIIYRVRQRLEKCQLRCSTINKYLYFCTLPSKPQMNLKNNVLKLAPFLHLRRAVTIKGKHSVMLNQTKYLTRLLSRKMQTNKSCFMHLLKTELKFDNFATFESYMTSLYLFRYSNHSY